MRTLDPATAAASLLRIITGLILALQLPTIWRGPIADHEQNSTTTVKTDMSRRREGQYVIQMYSPVSLGNWVTPYGRRQTLEVVTSIYVGDVGQGFFSNLGG